MVALLFLQALNRPVADRWNRISIFVPEEENMGTGLKREGCAFVIDRGRRRVIDELAEVDEMFNVGSNW
jgi:hypothetical protein